MGTIAQHRAGIAANIAAVFTANETWTYERKSYPAGGNWIIGWPLEYEPQVDQGSARTILYSVRFEVPWGDDLTADDALETAMQAAKAAIESDRTLGGSCDSAVCLAFTNIGAAARLDESTVLQFVVPVEVFD